MNDDRVGELLRGATLRVDDDGYQGFVKMRMKRRRRRVTRAALVLMTLSGLVSAAVTLKGRRHTAPAQHRPPSVVGSRSVPTLSSDVPAEAGCGWFDPGSRARVLAPEDRSHWLEPWRAAVRTWPAHRLRDAIGVVTVPNPRSVDRVPAQLAAAGFSRVTVPVPWTSVDPQVPGRLRHEARAKLLDWLRTAHAQRLRIQVSLFGHEGNPSPSQRVPFELVEPAHKGTRELRISPASVPALPAGRSGMPSADGRRSLSVVFTAVDPEGRVVLSRPLDRALTPGAHVATVHLFGPFIDPASAAFETSARGWMSFMDAVCDVVDAATAGSAFDLELWNTGADFFAGARLFDPSPPIETQSSWAELVTRSARWAAAGACRRARLVNNGPRVPALPTEGHTLVVHGRRSSELDGSHRWWGPVGDLLPHRGPQPDYVLALPELPITSLPGSRGLHAPLNSGGDVILSSFNLNPGSMSPVRMADLQSDTVTWRLKTKAALRSFSAFAGSGMRAVHLYKAEEPFVGVVDPRDPDGGILLRSLRRFVDAFADGGPVSAARSLNLAGVELCGGGTQLPAGPEQAWPALRNAELVAFFPFQRGPRSFTVSTYVMTRSLFQAYDHTAPFSDPRRFDLPDERHTLLVHGIDGRGLSAELVDPVDGNRLPVQILARSPHRVVLRLPLTDSPRLLRLDER